MISYSPSQLTTAQACSRKWFFGSVLKIRSPPTKSQEIGTGIHKEMEQITQGLPTSGFEEPRVKAAARELARLEALRFPKLWPAERQVAVARDPKLLAEGLKIGQVGSNILIEQAIEILLGPSASGAPRKVIGFIDYFDGRDALEPMIRDYKTTSDLKYLKTEFELAIDTQLTVYSKWALDVSREAPRTKVQHVGIQTRGSPRVATVDAIHERADVETRWAGYVEHFDRLDRLRVLTNPADVPAEGMRNGECEKFGGCFYRAQCASAIFGVAEKENEMANPGLAEKLAALRAKQAGGQAPAAASNVVTMVQPTAPAASQAPSPAPNPTSGVLDKLAALRGKGGAAPAATATPATTATTAEDRKLQEIERKIDAVEASKPAPAVVSNTTMTTVSATAPRIGVLYVDCVPSKGAVAERLEDWAAPLLAAITSSTGKPWHSHQYREGVAHVCVGLKTLPVVAGLIVDGRSSLGGVALEALIPLAGVIVEGRR